MSTELKETKRSVELPHFVKRGVRIKRGGTRWEYLTEIVSRDLD